MLPNKGRGNNCNFGGEGEEEEEEEWHPIFHSLSLSLSPSLIVVARPPVTHSSPPLSPQLFAPRSSFSLSLSLSRSSSAARDASFFLSLSLSVLYFCLSIVSLHPSIHPQIHLVSPPPLPLLFLLLCLLAVATLDVTLERGVLDEGVPADGAEVGPLARVLPEVHPQRLGQREPPEAVAALERPLARVPPRVLRGRPLRGEAPPAPRCSNRVPQGAGKGLHASLVRPQVHHEVVADAERRGAVRAGCGQYLSVGRWFACFHHYLSKSLPWEGFRL